MIFSNISFYMSSQIAYWDRCKVTIVADVQNFSIMSQKNLNTRNEKIILGRIRCEKAPQVVAACQILLRNQQFPFFCVLGDFYALKVCHKIVHVSLCLGGFSVGPLSLYIKWLWPNYFVFFSVIPIDSSRQQKLDTYRVLFFYCSALKMTQCQPDREIQIRNQNFSTKMA